MLCGGSKGTHHPDAKQRALSIQTETGDSEWERRSCGTRRVATGWGRAVAWLRYRANPTALAQDWLRTKRLDN